MKKILIIVLALALVFSFAACDEAESTPSETETQEKETSEKTEEPDAEAPVVEIAAVITEESQVALLDSIFSGFVADYNAENGTNYVLKFLSGQNKDVINTRMSSNDRPDILSLDSPADVAQYVGDGLLLDITEYAEGYDWENTMFNWAYDLSKVDGKVYSLPYGYEGMVLWYNKAIMDELGLVAEEIDTLEEFEAATQAAQDAGYTPVMLGAQDWPWAQEWYLSIMFSYTGKQLVKDTVEGVNGSSWTNDEFKKAVELYKSWHDKGYLTDGKSYVLTADDAINAFSTGKCLFKMEGTWAPYWITPLSDEEKADIGVMLHPAINNTEEPHMPLAVGGMWAVPADTECPEISAYILDRLLDEDIQGDFLKSGLDVAPIAVPAEQFAGLDPVVENMWTLINGSLEAGNFGYTTWAFYPPETRVYLYEGIVDVLEGNITVDAYLERMQELNEKELAEGFKPVIPAAK